MVARTIARVALVACALSFASFVQADVKTNEEYLDLIKQATDRSPLGENLFGDETNLYTGSTSFVVTDISLKGNFPIPVELVRKLDISGVANAGDGLFADWNIDIPHLQGTFSTVTGWAASGATAADWNQRCTNATPAPDVEYQYNIFSAREYWNGNSLHLTSGGDQEMFAVRQSLNPNAPTDGEVYTWMTSGNWYFSCLSSTQNGVDGEAFVAHSPDGLKYRFDHVVAWYQSAISRPAGVGPLSSSVVSANSAVSINVAAGTRLPRENIWFMPTRVEDRYGNYVTYTYDSSNPERLTKIRGSDGREIDIAYNSDGRVASASANGRTWRYTYDTRFLSTVTLPDASKWTYNLSDVITHLISAVGAEAIRCENGEQPDATDAVGSIIHPSGAVGTFTFHQKRLGRSNVPKQCLEELGTDYVYSYYPLYFDVMGLVSKSIAGPGVDLTWIFDYGTVAASWKADCSSSCSTTRMVTVDGPDSIRRYTYGTKYQDTEGKLLETDVLSRAGKTLRTEKTTYKYPETGDAYPELFGLKLNGASDALAYWMPVEKKVITQDGSTYIWLANSFDKYARPASISRSGAIASRTDTTVYYDDTSLWVLGQIFQSKSDGVTSEAIEYNSYAQPVKVKSFGRTVQTLTYDMSTSGQLGAIATSADGDGNTTTLSSWKRGVPRKIVAADGATRAAVVDDNGWITSITDELGNKTSYGYDLMGRIASVAYPQGDSTSWNSISYTFEQVDSVEYGLEAGHWRQTQVAGNNRKLTYFDAMWQPIVVREYDASNTSATQRFSRYAYDHAGRVTFASFPSTSSSPSTGVWTEYDALGRTTSVSQDSELGTLITLTSYLSGNRVRVVDPRGYATTTTFQAFDQPAYEAPITVISPETAITEITRDIFGQVKEIGRGAQ